MGAADLVPRAEGLGLRPAFFDALAVANSGQLLKVWGEGFDPTVKCLSLPMQRVPITGFWVPELEDELLRARSCSGGRVDTAVYWI